MCPKSLLGLVLLAGLGLAKTAFSEVAVNGVDLGHGVGVRVPSSNNPITDVASNDIICNTDFVSPVSQTVIPVVAGEQLTAHFHRTSAGYTGPSTSEPLDPTNKGPILAYLASVPSATQPSVTGLKWFKIWEDGYDISTHQWGSDHLFVNRGNATFTIPSCVPSGQYLLRVEAINLLHAGSYPGAQFFMSCAQLDIKSSSAVKVPSTVSFPGAYKAGDPGIVTSIFGVSSYTPPGPRVFQC